MWDILATCDSQNSQFYSNYFLVMVIGDGMPVLMASSNPDYLLIKSLLGPITTTGNQKFPVGIKPTGKYRILTKRYRNQFPCRVLKEQKRMK
jgi:hypothetical protein